MKRIIVDTSTGCLDYLDHNYNIPIIRINLYFGEECYRDGEDIKAEEFFARLKRERSLPTTSQPSIGYLYDFFLELYNLGYEEAIVLTISSALSGTINGVENVKEMLKDKINIITFDTKTVCYNEGYFAYCAAQWIEEGIPTEKILQKLEFMRNNNSLYFCLNSLEYVIKNGRLSNAAGLIATMFKIKPLLQIQPDGKMIVVEKIRTLNKALQSVVDSVYKSVQGKKYTLLLVFTEYNDTAKELRNLLNIKFPGEKVIEMPTTPVIGTHIGYDGAGVGYFIEEENEV